MSIRLKIALALLVTFALGAAVLLGSIRVAFERNVGFAAEIMLEDLEPQFNETAGCVGTSDSDGIVSSLKTQNGDEYALLASSASGYELLATTDSGLDASALDDFDGELKSGVNRLDISTAGEDRFLIAAIPLGEIAGADAVLVAKADIGPLMARLSNGPILVVSVMIGIYAAVALVVTFLLNRLVLGRLSGITEILENALVRMAGGDFDAFNVERKSSKDEIGHFENTVFGFMKVVGDALKSRA